MAPNGKLSLKRHLQKMSFCRQFHRRATATLSAVWRGRGATTLLNRLSSHPSPCFADSIHMEQVKIPTRTNQQFAHVLRFKCPRCAKSINAVRFSEDMSREMIAPLVFQQRCDCGWAGQSTGLAATRHTIKFANESALSQTDDSARGGSKLT